MQLSNTINYAKKIKCDKMRDQTQVRTQVHADLNPNSNTGVRTARAAQEAESAQTDKAVAARQAVRTTNTGEETDLYDVFRGRTNPYL